MITVMRLFYLALAVSIVSLSLSNVSDASSTRRTESATPAPISASNVSAPGRIEGATPVQQLAFAESGRIIAIQAQEGQMVHQNDILAELDCAPLEYEIAAVSEELAAANRGARPEEKQKAAAELEKARHSLALADLQLNRARKLSKQNHISDEALDTATYNNQSAKAALAVAEAAAQIANNPLPTQERQAIEKRLDGLRAHLTQCSLRAPSDGIVLRRLLEPGTVVSATFPVAVLGFANTSKWRVRAEVDENDLQGLLKGGAACIRALAYGDTALVGTITSLSPVMGRRTILEGDPAEKLERDVLEVMIDLDKPPPVLVIGLRVRVSFAACNP